MTGPYARQAKTTGLWSAQYRDARGNKCYTTGHPNKRTAQRAAIIEGEAARRGNRRDPTGHRMRLEQWAWERWWPSRGVAASTQRSDKPRMVNHVIPRWGAVRLSEIGRLDVQAWLVHLTSQPQPSTGRPLSARSARHCLVLLSSCLQAAVEENILDANPCRGVRKPDLPLPDHRYLSDDEVDALFSRLDGWTRLMCELLIDSGLRIGEGAALHRHRVHLDGGDPYVTVFETWNSDTRLMQPHPKGKKRRDVPISHELAHALQRYWARTPDPGTCGERHEDGSRCRSALAVPNTAGGPADPSNFSQREWWQARLESGVEATPHALRHTYASRMISAGVTLEELQGLMGHVSFQTTLGYAHLLDSAVDRRRKVRDAAAARREASRGRSGPARGRSTSTESGSSPLPELG